MGSKVQKGGMTVKYCNWIFKVTCQPHAKRLETTNRRKRKKILNISNKLISIILELCNTRCGEIQDKIFKSSKTRFKKKQLNKQYILKLYHKIQFSSGQTTNSLSYLHGKFFLFKL